MNDCYKVFLCFQDLLLVLIKHFEFSFDSLLLYELPFMPCNEKESAVNIKSVQHYLMSS